MSNMLRKSTGHVFGCCDHCARHKKPEQKPGPRERRLARARENKQWKTQAIKEMS